MDAFGNAGGISICTPCRGNPSSPAQELLQCNARAPGSPRHVSGQKRVGTDGHAEHFKRLPRCAGRQVQPSSRRCSCPIPREQCAPWMSECQGCIPTPPALCWAASTTRKNSCGRGWPGSTYSSCCLWLYREEIQTSSESGGHPMSVTLALRCGPGLPCLCLYFC